MWTSLRFASATIAVATVVFAWQASGQSQPAPSRENCPVTHEDLTKALKKSAKPSGGPSNGGFDNNEWAAVVTREGVVCAITFSGSKATDQWLGSRAIAAEKANTANAFSLDQTAISTANLYAGAQPGGFLFGIATSDPPAIDAIAAGDTNQLGTNSDPMLGKRIGGIIVFGGGLALYDGHALVGGLGVSGDSSCADHNVAWRLRHALNLDHAPAGPAPDKTDRIVYDLDVNGVSRSGFGHPKCKKFEPQVAAEIGAGVQNQPAR